MSEARALPRPEGNLYDKYATRNPIARLMMAGFLSAFDRLALASSVREAHEIGCGEGELCRRLASLGFEVRGCDVGAAVIAEAERRSAADDKRIPFAVRDIHDLSPARDAAPLIVCCEVLEHLEAPAEALDVLAGLARPWLLASVPREPLWRLMNMARGRYLDAFGNTPGHLQHWSQTGFLTFLRTRFDVVQYAAPIPWTLALCRVRP